MRTWYMHVRAHNRIAQIKPCRVSIETVYRGDVDPDWWYILRGSVFGFRVIDPDFKGAYDCRRCKRYLPTRNQVSLSKG